MEDLTFQQKLWKGTEVMIHAVKPLILYLSLPALLTCAGMILFGGRDARDMVSRSGNFYYTAGILLTIYLLHIASRKRGSTIWQETTLELRGTDWKRMLLLAGMGMAAAVFFSALLTVLPMPDALMESYSRTSETFRLGNDRILAMVSVIVLAPVTEEIVFRGYLLGRLLQWFEIRHGILLSAVIFALCHVSPVWMVYAGLMGILLAWVSVREDNLVYSIALHMGFNASVIPVELFNVIWGIGREDSSAFGSMAAAFLWGAAALCLALLSFDRYKKEKREERV